MARHKGAVLVDTNVVLECWRLAAWRPFAGGYRIETVEEVVIETQTGFQRRRAEQQVGIAELRDGLAAVHQPADRDLAALLLRAPDIALDPGERALWAHAVTRDDDWILCGPDRASLRMGVRLGLRERLVALEALLADAGFRPREPLRANYTSAWLARALNEIVLTEGARRP
ncbi:MAG: hypothetical protein M5U07_07490 [Xanthobacteraceae bacterium]|nr:hypothetical protein [Xanthobacteraceae bacterium]